MLLENKYYKVESRNDGDGKATFKIAVLPTCDVYRGHFPGRPVCPGVCNIETVKELASMLTGRRLAIDSIRRCRMTAVATPTSTPELMVDVEAEPTGEGFMVKARIYDDKQSYMDYTGEMRSC